MAFHYDFTSPDSHSNQFYGLQTIRMLEGLGVTIPEEIVDARADVDALEARVKDAPADDAAELAVLTALGQNPKADITKLLTKVDLASLERRAVTKVAYLARMEHGSVVRTHADELIANAAQGPFAEHVATIEAAAELDSLDLARLADQHRPDDVIAVADATTALKKIRRLQQMRFDLTVKVGRTNVATPAAFAPYGGLVHWRTPSLVVADDHELPDFIANVKAGAEPWLATRSQMEARRDELAAERVAELADAAQAEHKRRHPDLTPRMWTRAGNETPPKNVVDVPEKLRSGALAPR